MLLLPALEGLAGPALDTELWLADNGQDDALVGGAELAWPMPALTLRAGYAQGRFNPGGDVEQLETARLLAVRSLGVFELGAGYAWYGFETRLQPGWEWAYPEEEAERNADAHGPVLYAAWRLSLGAGGWAVRASATGLPFDFGEFDDLGRDGANVDLRAGLYRAGDRLEAGVGWRGLYFADLPPRDENGRSFNRNGTQGLLLHLALMF